MNLSCNLQYIERQIEIEIEFELLQKALRGDYNRSEPHMKIRFNRQSWAPEIAQKVPKRQLDINNRLFFCTQSINLYLVVLFLFRSQDRQILRRVRERNDALFERAREPVEVGESARLVLASALQEYARGRTRHQAHALATCCQVLEERRRAQRDHTVQALQRRRRTKGSGM